MQGRLWPRMGRRWQDVLPTTATGVAFAPFMRTDGRFNVCRRASIAHGPHAPRSFAPALSALQTASLRHGERESAAATPPQGRCLGRRLVPCKGDSALARPTCHPAITDPCAVEQRHLRDGSRVVANAMRFQLGSQVSCRPTCVMGYVALRTHTSMACCLVSAVVPRLSTGGMR